MDDHINTLLVDEIIIGNTNKYKMPLNDGTNGQCIVTNGSGTLEFKDNLSKDGIIVPNQVTRWNSNNSIKGSSVTINDSGKLLCSSLVSSGLSYPILDGTNGQVLTTNGSGTLAFSSFIGGQQYLLYAISTTTYTTQISVNDHIRFGTVKFSRGNTITLNTSTPYNTNINTDSIGRITLKSGTYKLMCDLEQVEFGNSNGYVAINWYNSDSNTFIDGPLLASVDLGVSSKVTAIYTTLSIVRIEARIIARRSLDNISRAILEIEQLA